MADRRTVFNKKDINLLGSNYYPTDNLEDYIFYNSLVDYNPALLNDATSLYNDYYNYFKNPDLKRAGIDSLKGLWQREREKEIQFLQKYFSEYDPEKTDWSDLIEAYNELYSAKDIMRRNLAIMDQYKRRQSKVKDVDIIGFFPTYIKNAFFEYLRDNGPLSLVDNPNAIPGIIKRGFELMYDSALTKSVKQQLGDDIKVYQAYKELFEKMNSNDPIIQDIMQQIGMDNINNYINQLNEKVKNLDAIKQKKQIKNFTVKQQGQKAGNLLEIVAAAFIDRMKNFNGYAQDTFRVGQTGGTADVVQVFQSTVNFNTLELYDMFVKSMTGKFVNERSLERIRELYKNLSEKDDIVYISDKNYKLSSISKYGFGGKDFSLNSFQNFLNTLQPRETKIDELIFILVNTGRSKYFLGHDLTTLEDYLATKIAYVLFDDISITMEEDTPQPNAIHLFNLNNIYIPFSIFLEAAQNAMEDLDYRAYVNAKIHPHPYSYIPVTDRALVEEDWIKEREIRYKGTSVTYRFFQNFTSFITKVMKGKI